MQFILPDLLAEARGMSVAVYATGLALGCLLWLLGWWGHRFWIVLFSTVIAGIAGLAVRPGNRRATLCRRAAAGRCRWCHGPGPGGLAGLCRGGCRCVVLLVLARSRMGRAAPGFPVAAASSDCCCSAPGQ